MPALIIGVRKALTVLTMKHCRNTLILVKKPFPPLHLGLLRLTLSHLSINERQQIGILHVLSSNISNVLGQIISCRQWKDIISIAMQLFELCIKFHINIKYSAVITKCQTFKRLLKELSEKVDWFLEGLQLQRVQGIKDLTT